MEIDCTQGKGIVLICQKPGIVEQNCRHGHGTGGYKRVKGLKKTWVLKEERVDGHTVRNGTETERQEERHTFFLIVKKYS